MYIFEAISIVRDNISARMLCPDGELRMVMGSIRSGIWCCFKLGYWCACCEGVMKMFDRGENILAVAFLKIKK